MAAEFANILWDSGSGNFAYAEAPDRAADPSVESLTATHIDPTGLLLSRPDTGATVSPEAAGLSGVWLVVIGLMVTMLTVAISVGLLVRRWKKKQAASDAKVDPFLDDYHSEKIPAPRFEDDVPSVLELDMQYWDQWEMMTESEEIPGRQN